MSLCERGASGLFDGVVGSRRSNDVERDSSCSSSPLNCDMMPSRRMPQPGEPSRALASVVMRSGLGDAPMAMAFLSSASLTLILLRLVLIGILECLTGRSLTVCVGEGERERRSCGGLTITRDWSSDMSIASGRRSMSPIAGSGLSPLIDGLAEKTSATSAGAAGRRDTPFGNGGTGGGKASKRGELYVEMDVVDGEDVIVRCEQKVSYMSAFESSRSQLTDRSRVEEVPNILPRNADVLARTDDFAD